MFLEQLTKKFVQVSLGFGVEDVDSEEGHDLGSHVHQDQPPDGALEQVDHLGELGTERLSC